VTTVLHYQLGRDGEGRVFRATARSGDTGAWIGDPGGAAVIERAPASLGRSRESSAAAAILEPNVTAAIEFVGRNVSRVFGVEALVGVSGMPRRTLEIAFRRWVGIAPYAYIMQVRLARARELLSDGEALTLTEIAAACGFRDLRRFRLAFRRELGISPSEFRAAARSCGD
jgi:transcriptional regulator GlxA family with amidase domain